jgi:hypothetical protein
VIGDNELKIVCLKSVAEILTEIKKRDATGWAKIQSAIASLGAEATVGSGSVETEEAFICFSVEPDRITLTNVCLKQEETAYSDFNEEEEDTYIPVFTLPLLIDGSGGIWATDVAEFFESDDSGSMPQDPRVIAARILHKKATAGPDKRSAGAATTPETSVKTH